MNTTAYILPYSWACIDSIKVYSRSVHESNKLYLFSRGKGIPCSQIIRQQKVSDNSNVKDALPRFFIQILYELLKESGHTIIRFVFMYLIYYLLKCKSLIVLIYFTI